MEARKEHITWRTSSYTSNQTSCVEIGCAPDTVGIRDTKNRAGGTLHISPATFSALITTIKANRLG